MVRLLSPTTYDMSATGQLCCLTYGISVTVQRYCLALLYSARLSLYSQSMGLSFTLAGYL